MYKAVSLLLLTFLKYARKDIKPIPLLLILFVNINCLRVVHRLMKLSMHLCNHKHVPIYMYEQKF